MSDSPSRLVAKRRHNKWLLLIAAFKLSQALLFIAIGVGARHLLHKDVGDLLAQLADHLRFSPESRFVNFILDKASLLDDPLLRRIGVAAFSYAALGIVEGTGLYLEKAWGEYLTLVITASFLRRVTWFRYGLLIVNLLVFIYLLKIVSERGKRMHGAESS
jgi:uncharacterized membrane protein (DUF2068 family)